MLQVHRKQAEMNCLRKNFLRTSFNTMDTGSHNEALKEGSKSLGPKMSFTENSTHQGS